MSAFRPSATERTQETGSSALDRFEQAVWWFYETHMSWPRIADVASILGTTSRGLWRMLRGTSPLPCRQALSRIRILAAAREIAAGGKIDAARQIAGYANKTAFNRLFLRQVGCLPIEYRARCAALAAEPETPVQPAFDAMDVPVLHAWS